MHSRSVPAAAVLLLLLLATAAFATATSAASASATATAATSLTISVSSSEISLGDSVLICVSESTAAAEDCPMLRLEHEVVPFMDQLQTGAATNYSRLVFLPTEIGVHTVQVAIVSSPLPAPFPRNASIPAGSVVSNAVKFVVNPAVAVPAVKSKTMIGMEWEPWFTLHNMQWGVGAEAIPLLGRYSSFDEAVPRMHAVWLSRALVDFIIVDWSNNIWDTPHWSDRHLNVQELCNATIFTMDRWQQMLSQGETVPKVSFLLGLDNGPQAPPEALNEEIAWMEQTLLSKYSAELFVYLDGKPLITIIDGGDIHSHVSPPIVSQHFTIRWMGSQLQSNPKLAQQGFWSWMDGGDPVPTPCPNGETGCYEAVTITPAYFSQGGWLGAPAVSRHGGSTYLGEVDSFFKYTPEYGVICQWNEFAGQPNGSPTYVDCYNSTLSNDMEPTSLTACGYPRPNDRACGGWGYFYLNLMQVTNWIYKNHLLGEFAFSVLVIQSPPYGAWRSANASVEVQWSTFRYKDDCRGGIVIAVNADPVVQLACDATSYTIGAEHFPTGSGAVASISVAMPGSSCFSTLSYTRWDPIAATPQDCVHDVDIYTATE